MTHNTSLLNLSLERGQQQYANARELIPGGVQLLSKRPEMFAPKRWPSYYRSAVGCEVVDLDGNRFLDFTHNGVGSCLLGYAHPRVNAAVVERVSRGVMCTLNAVEEVDLARRLVALHPWAEQARFGRCGGEGMAIAVRIARASTQRDLVLFCGYHGWNDWYLAANLSADRALDGHLLPGLSPHGVPRGLTGTAIPFTYNRFDEVSQLFSEHGDKVAAVVMEPTRNTPPADGYLASIRSLCNQYGARLVFDEVTTGLRLRRGGVHLDYGIEPDLAVFAKALGNGHPIAAVIGKEQTMQAAQESFISSTYWTEAVGPTAAVTTLAIMDEVDVSGHVRRMGEQFREACQTVAKRVGLPIKLGGYPALTSLSFDHADNVALTTLYTVLMLDQGILAGGGFYPTLAHTPDVIEQFAKCAAIVFPRLAQAAEQGNAVALLEGAVKHTGFARLT